MLTYFEFTIGSHTLFNYVIANFLLGFVLFLISIFVLTRNLKNPLNQTFASYSFSIAWWSFFTIPLIASTNSQAGYFWDQVCLTGAVFIPATFLHFVLVFLRRVKKYWFCIIVCYATSLFFLYLNWTHCLAKEVQPNKLFNFYTVPSIVYTAFVSYFSALSTVGVLSLYWATKQRWDKPRFSKQAKWLFLTSCLGYLGGGTNFLLVYGINIPLVTPVANYAVLVYGISIAYIILKYRFLNIEVIIKKTLVFAGISFFVFACFSVPLFLIPNTLHDGGTGRLKWWLLALTGMAVAALVGPLNQFLVDVTDKYLFQKKTNYRVLLREATEYLAHVASLRSQARTIVAFFLKKARLANASVYAFTSRGSASLSLTASRPAVGESELKQIDLSHPIVKFFSHHQGPIEITALKELKKAKGFLNPEDIEKIIGLMNSLKAEAAVPCLGGKVAARLEKKDVYLKAVLFLGHQKSDEPYSEEDLDVFFTLGQESSIAFENARLYDEVVERTRMLEQTNTDLSDANEKLKVTQASLIVAEKNATMVGMAKAIGHEVNNPLSTVGGRAVWIYKDELRKCREVVAQNLTFFPDHTARELEKRFFNIEDNAKRIEKSAKRIEVVVKTLTDILKDTRGEKGPLSLLVLCREAREATRFLTYDENLSGCQITENIASNIVILGNLEQLLQVFINMIKNAYEAMVGQQYRRIEIRGNIDPDNPKMARIEFSDNGPGIPEHILPKIWGQGFSTKIINEEHIGATGQGQGLFICKHVIESIHNGEIFVESALGKGTTFVIKVPLADLES